VITRRCANGLCGRTFSTTCFCQRYCCVACARSAANRRWYKKHRARVAAHRKEYRARPEEVERRRAYKPKWQEANRARINAARGNT
jgi:hypothetical protein